MSAQMELMAVKLGFTLQELALNQRGEISSQQAWQCIKSAIINGSLFLLAFCGLVAILFLIRPRKGLWMMYVCLASCATSILGFLAYQNVADVITRRVTSEEGILQFEAGHRQSTNIIVGSTTRIGVPDTAQSVLMAGQKYRVYILAHSKHFLSIERIIESSVPQKSNEASINLLR